MHTFILERTAKTQRGADDDDDDDDAAASVDAMRRAAFTIANETFRRCVLYTGPHTTASAR
jgi:hypothetical protein|eukprot:31196-Pelagococcus_subviridis.AAC.4